MPYSIAVSPREAELVQAAGLGELLENPGLFTYDPAQTIAIMTQVGEVEGLDAPGVGALHTRLASAFTMHVADARAREESAQAHTDAKVQTEEVAESAPDPKPPRKRAHKD